jgi:hypothetical protein
MAFARYKGDAENALLTARESQPHSYFVGWAADLCSFRRMSGQNSLIRLFKVSNPTSDPQTFAAVDRFRSPLG